VQRSLLPLVESLPTNQRQQPRPRREVEHLVNPRLMGGLVCVVLLSIVLHQAVLFFAGAILLLVWTLSWLWGRYCLDGVVYRRRLSAPAVGFGDEVTLTVEIANRKLVPLPWLEVADECPAVVELVTGDLHAFWKTGRAILPTVLTLWWYERVTRHYRLRCLQRGEYVFGPATLRSGDLFGFATQNRDVGECQTLLVYPKMVPVEALGVPVSFPWGGVRRPDQLYPDPLRFVGIRPYARGDSLRQVHWKATARLGAPQVKTYESSTTLRAMLYVNVDTLPHLWQGIRPDLLELVICAAASLASHLLHLRYQVGLVANGMVAGKVGPARVAAGRAPSQLTAILALLARLSPSMTVPFAHLLRVEGQQLPVGTTVLLVTGLFDAAVIEQVRVLQARGHRVIAVLAGDDLGEAHEAGLDLLWLGGEARWRDLQALQFVALGPKEARQCGR
jgi:uncharacterized protein (DUF58 family)